MAPIYIDLPTESLPTLALLSLIFLFVLAITFLALCTSCKRHSFDVDNSSTVNKNATLVRVVKPGDVDDTVPKRTITVLPEDLQLDPNQKFKPWRSHTLGTPLSFSTHLTQPRDDGER
ncbi:uncharacterized protein si:ch73-204p21.2 isoform X2 [Neoarius graeffei]|uniref:uncharacterized protein si:ch73-204p21.2 isoform X2 n=1 Tax=Neoarius graeffei TaxID=443677 RepID=UPI00298D442A|nr:uncharacterized protein si:ch73-204p21.2 isoform X2 [Neoarius graeffei]